LAYIGVQPAEAYTSFAVQHFTTSATTSYTLDNPVANENDIALFINNVRQQPGSSYAYTASGTTLTLSAATSASDTMYCVFIGKAVQTVTPNLNPVTIDSGTVATFNRTTSDGDIVELQKDGTTIVSMGVNGAVGYYQFYPTGSVAIRGGGDDIRPSNNTGANRDNLTDLGDSTVRWRNLYLGGSVYLGGTGSANALDDYEEGTWTPVYNATGITYSSQQGKYTKIGDIVIVSLSIATSDTTSISGSGTLNITGLPFTSESTNPRAVMAVLSGRFNSNQPNYGLVKQSTSAIELRNDFNTVTQISDIAVVAAANQNVTEAVLIYNVS